MTSLITKPQATRHGRVFAPACTNHRRWRAAARAEQQSGKRRHSAPPAAAEPRDAQITLICTVGSPAELECDIRPERQDCAVPQGKVDRVP
jgi:hypothetical protein